MGVWVGVGCRVRVGLASPARSIQRRQKARVSKFLLIMESSALALGSRSGMCPTWLGVDLGFGFGFGELTLTLTKPLRGFAHVEVLHIVGALEVLAHVALARAAKGLDGVELAW